MEQVWGYAYHWIDMFGFMYRFTRVCMSLNWLYTFNISVHIYTTTFIRIQSLLLSKMPHPSSLACIPIMPPPRSERQRCYAKVFTFLNQIYQPRIYSKAK